MPSPRRQVGLWKHRDEHPVQPCPLSAFAGFADAFCHGFLKSKSADFAGEGVTDMKKAEKGSPCVAMATCSNITVIAPDRLHQLITEEYTKVRVSTNTEIRSCHGRKQGCRDTYTAPVKDTNL